MESLKKLECFMKIFQQYGSQHFTLTNLYTPLSFRQQIAFAITLGFNLGVAYYCNLYSFKNNVDISSGKNILHYIMKFVTFGARFVLPIVNVIESFIRTDDLKNIFIESMKIQRILRKNFLHKLKCGRMKRKFVARILLIFVGSFGLEMIYFYKNYHTKLIYLGFSLRFFRTFFSQMIVLKFCFYIEFICVHLSSILCVVKERFLEFSKTEQEAVFRVMALRCCYNRILTMMRSMRHSFWWTISFYTFVTVLSIIRRLYKIYTMAQGLLPISEGICE